jgi:hypothetical protein
MEKNEVPTTFTKEDLENFDRHLTYATENKFQAVGSFDWVANDYPKFLAEIAMLRQQVMELSDRAAGPMA